MRSKPPSNPQDFPKYELTLLRHGESVGNKNGVIQGRVDFPLTPLGRKQAAALGDRWKSAETVFDALIASPQSRALETASIVADALGIFVYTDELWMERDNGNKNGLPVEERFEEGFFYHPYVKLGETGETITDTYLRGAKALQSIILRPPGKYLIVSHGGILNMVLYAALGITPLANFQGPRFRFGNTGFAKLDYFPHMNQWRVLKINDLEHLEQSVAGNL